MAEDRHIVFALPSYTGQIDVLTATALMQECAIIEQIGWNYQVLAAVGDSLVARARNSLAAEFLDDTEGTDLIWIDCDVSWEPGAIARLCTHPVDLVGGAYRTRSDPERYVVSFLDRKYLPVNEETGLLEVLTLMGGFTRMTRACLEKMRENSVKYIGPDGRHCHAMFDCEVYSSQYWGEDTTFCRRWRDWCDGQCWIDMDLNLTHRGPKAFTGNFKEWLQVNAEQQTGKPIAELEKEFEADKAAGFENKEGYWASQQKGAAE